MYGKFVCVCVLRDAWVRALVGFIPACSALLSER
jgi:hypothetical protein